jgi:steroid delta-isomerase-like uncharacterized protein
MSDENKALIHRWFKEVWNEGRAEAIDEMMAEDCIAHGLADESGNELRGPAGFKPFFHNFRGAFPDIEVIVEDTIAEGDKVAARCTVRATHRGDGIGLTASHRPVTFTGMCFVRVQNGKIADAWNNFDFMNLFQQIGAIQPLGNSPTPRPEGSQ